MEIFLGILGIIIFFVGAYFMGNFLMGTLRDNLYERIIPSLFGIIAWILIFLIILLMILFYRLGILIYNGAQLII